MDKKKTGELIKKMRIEKGYTQLELGDLLGVSNKAVSRWENGDSFPDIGVLENLSQILDLKIQDIVIGEVVESSYDTAVTEIVRVATIQSKQKKRNIVTWAVCLILFFYLLIWGYYRLSGSTIGDWITTRYNYSLVGVLLLVSIKCVLDKEPLNPFRDKYSKWFACVHIISGVYISTVTCIIMAVVNQGKVPFDMKLSSVGAFLHNQIIIIYIFNMIVLAMECFQINHHDEAIRLDTYFGIALIHLVLLYSDLLHRITSPEEIYTIFINGTIVTLMETTIMIVITLIIKKYTKSLAIR